MTGRGLDAARDELAVAAEDRLDGPRLGRIALPRPAPVRRYVVDPVRRGFALLQRTFDRTREAAPFGIGRDQPVGVVGAAESDDLGVDSSAARGRAIVRLDHEEGRSFAEQRAGAFRVVRAARGGTEIVPLRQEPEGVELRHVPPGARIVVAARERDLRLAAPNGPVRATDRHQARLRRAGEVRVRAFQRVRLRDVEDRRRLQAFDVEQRVECGRRRLAEAADVDAPVLVPCEQRALEDVHRVRDLFVAADEQRGTVAVAVLREIEAGILHRERRARERELIVPRHRPQRLARRELLRVEVGDLRGLLCPKRRRVVARDRRDPAASLDQAAPRVLGPDAERRGETDPGDDDALHTGTIRS